jgi:2-oxoglutarate dehydrogenase E2 component (dihydrolipoamide succinyltransferase)
MAVDVVIPQVGESVQEAILAEWFKEDGDSVAKDEALFVIETDKVTLEVVAEVAGKLSISVPAGETVTVGAVVATIDPSAQAARAEPASAPAEQTPIEKPPAKPAAAPPVAAPAPSASTPDPPASEPAAPEPTPQGHPAAMPAALPPSVRRLVAEKQLDISRIQGTGPAGRITKGDVLLHLEQAPAGVPEACAPPAELAAEVPPAEVRKPMTPIRRRIAARLVAAKQNTAMLTTFNDVDMGRVMGERAKYKERFKEKHAVRPRLHVLFHQGMRGSPSRDPRDQCFCGRR